MKQYLLTILALLLLLVGCQSTKKTIVTTSAASNTTNDPNRKQNMLDGTWEANYIINTPKPFAEMYPKVKPSITFNSLNGSINGITGCNNFSGGFTLDGNRIKFGDSFATTRKMCPDMTGEKAFLETLMKVNTYTLTDQGKTLHLIMGDIAVMRLKKE